MEGNESIRPKIWREKGSNNISYPKIRKRTININLMHNTASLDLEEEDNEIIQNQEN
jgi:hypothetical protein